MSKQTYVFVKDVKPYIMQGSTLDVPKPWIQHGMHISAVAHLKGTDKKLFFTQAMVAYFINDGLVERER